MKTATQIKTLVAMALISAMAAGFALAANTNPGVLPPNSKAHGMSYGQWGDAWWQWGFSFPTNSNPILDQTGQFGALGQSGSVWFLAGTTGGEAERTLTVPTGKTLFVPIVNNLWINIPRLGDNPWSAEQEAFARAYIAVAIEEMTNVDCVIDGKAVQDLHK